MQTGSVIFDAQSATLQCQGCWDLENYPHLQAAFLNIQPTSQTLTLDGSAITKLDTAGAWLIVKTMRLFGDKNIKTRLENLSAPYQRLVSLVKQQMTANVSFATKPHLPLLARVGRKVIQQMREFLSFLNFTGRLSIEARQIFFHPKLLRLTTLVSTIDKTGLQALGIIALLSFMIGVVITYQMGFQLRNYGANVFVVNLLGLSVLREFGPLLSAIMVAGRTGSAFTAQLGMMKINQEMDALSTMGVSPGQLLLLPRIFGLFLALPLLTMWADIFGILGGMLMADSMLGVDGYDFLIRFQHEIPLRSLFIGLCKAPVFALIIASIGCYEGTKVKSNADSVGSQTTRSVVLGIFFIILADALFSIVFSKLRL